MKNTEYANCSPGESSPHHLHSGRAAHRPHRHPRLPGLSTGGHGQSQGQGQGFNNGEVVFRSRLLALRAL